MKIPYVEIDENKKTITFYFKESNYDTKIFVSDHFIDNSTELINCLIIENAPLAINWNHKTYIEKAIIDKSFKDYKPKSTQYWFFDLPNLKEIIGLENLDTSEVTDMRFMFSECYSLKTINLSNFDTSKVKNISYMFAHDQSLTELDLSSFSNKSIIWENKPDEEDDNGYAAMFWDCINLKTIYIGEKWDETQPILPRSGWLFANCPSLIGGQGSRPFDPEYDGPYARIDGGQEKPGYFTLKEE